MIKGMKFFGVAVLLLTTLSPANAATVWVPADNNANTLLTFGYTGPVTLAIFDEQDLSFAGARLLLAPSDTVSFAQNGADFQATNLAGSSLLLSNSMNFIFAMTGDNGVSWIADTALTAFTPTSYLIQFSGLGQVYAIDVQAVPLPAALWLFLMPMLGLLGFARRRH